jgi:hypothetical protein
MRTSRRWVIESRGALVVGRTTCLVTGAGLAVSVLVSLVALVRDKPFAPGIWLLLPGIPALALGQAWAIAVLGARNPQMVRRGFLSRGVRAPSGVSGRRFFFGALATRQAIALLAIAALGWVSAITAFPGLTHGGPDGASPGCPYRLNNHGSIMCASRAAYEHAGASSQRFASGIFAFFFAIQFGTAASELVRRRDSSRSASLTLATSG